MKQIIFLVTLGYTVLSFGAAPKCVNIGTRSEGWSTPNHQIKYDKCKNKVAFCGAVGSRSEGWYAGEVLQQHLLGWANCSKREVNRPVCINIGTRSEGWTTPQGKVIWDKCSQKVAVCSAIGTRSEGWYAATIKQGTVSFIGWANCSK